MSKSRARNGDQEVDKPTHPGWSAGRSFSHPDDKLLMAEYFVRHDFLVRPGEDPESSPRLTSGIIFVNPGTTPNTVVNVAVNWMEKNWASGPFSIKWYTPGMLVPATLMNFINKHYDYRSAASLLLFPGLVDQDTESVSGEESIKFVKQCQVRFAYSILSSHYLDLSTGDTYFHFPTEVPLQAACAKLNANQKYLFLDPSKLETVEGVRGYSLKELLQTSNSVTIYTVESPKFPIIKKRFEELCRKLGLVSKSEKSKSKSVDFALEEFKTLRLCCISRHCEAKEDLIFLGKLS